MDTKAESVGNYSGRLTEGFMGDEKRYYYTDRLAAAWMTKQFGMMFETGSISGFHCSVFSSGKNTPHYFADDGDDDFKGIIHPDSLELLKPREGDKDENGFVFCERTQAWWRENGFSITGSGEPVLRALLPEESRTAKRGGKPFFWPEIEE
jgi:hypothetical protein